MDFRCFPAFSGVFRRFPVIRCFPVFLVTLQRVHPSCTKIKKYLGGGIRVDFPKNCNVLVQKYGISSGVFPCRSRLAELQVTEYSVCESGTSSRSIFLVRKYGISSHIIFFVRKRNYGNLELQVTDYSVCGGRTAELQDKALVWKRNCGTSSRSIFLLWKRNFKASVYSFCGIAELQTFKSHTILCAETELRNFKSKYIVQKRNILCAEAELVTSCKRSAF